MGRRGPAPTPSAELRLRGTLRQDRVFNEPQPPPDPPEPPDWLDEDALAVWDQLAPQLQASGLLTCLDVNALARYCTTWVRWRAAEDFLAKHGSVYPLKDEAGRTKYLQQFPHVAIANKLGQSLTRMEQEFGMTPSARSRIHVDLKWTERPMDEASLRKQRFFPTG